MKKVEQTQDKMKSKIITILIAVLSLILIALSLSGVNADVTVNYEAYNAVINNDGSTSYLTTPISNYSVIGFLCSTADCSAITGQLFTPVHTDSNAITLVYPQSLLSSNGYGIYFYKEDYVGWEVLSTWNGDGVLTPARKVYFTKKQTGSAEISSFNYNGNLSVNNNIKINANIISPLVNAGTLSYSPSELADYRKAKVLATLEVRDALNNIIRTETQNLLIPYSGQVNIEFNELFASAGNYNITLYTDVTDGKIINSVRKSRNILFTVNPTTPIIPDTTAPALVILSPNRILYNYANIPVVISANDINLDKVWFNYGGANITYTAPITINFPEGLNTINVYANDSAGNIASRSFTFRVNTSAVIIPDTTAPTLTIVSPNKALYNYTNIPVTILANDTNLDKIWFNYNGGANITYSAPITINFPEGLNTINVYANDSAGNIGIKSFTFRVNTTAMMNNSLSIGNITTIPVMPFVNNGTVQNITITFISNNCPLFITFNLYNSSNEIISARQGPLVLSCIENLFTRIVYVIPSNLNNGIYFLNMTIVDVYNNNNTYSLGNFTVNKIIQPPNNNPGGHIEDDSYSKMKNTGLSSLRESSYEPINNTIIDISTKKSESWKGYYKYLFLLILLILLLLILIIIVYILGYI